jgi:hypothetical protein
MGATRREGYCLSATLEVIASICALSAMRSLRILSIGSYCLGLEAIELPREAPFTGPESLQESRRLA